MGSRTSIEAQKRGDDMYGGIQLEIIPTYPLSRLRRLTGRNISLLIAPLAGGQLEAVVDESALVFDLLKTISDSYGSSTHHSVDGKSCGLSAGRH